MTNAVQTGEYFEHITGPGERWDTIAFHYYNNASLSHLIIAANQHGFIQPLQPIPAIIPSSTILRVPVIDVQRIDDEQLPPWKRSS